MKNKLWHILLIDDNPDDRADLRQMLLRGSDQRYRFTEAELGAEGLRITREQREDPYDCVLLDYYLPDMNAEEMLTAFRDGADIPPFPVVVVTGSVREEGPKLLRAGAQDYIGKSWITPESLTRAVENAIERFALLTERSRAKEDLRLERERLGLALTSGQMGVYDWNMVDDIFWWSPEIFPVFGVNPDSFVPSRDSFSALIYPDDRNIFWQRLGDCIAQRQPFWHEFQIVRPDGGVRWIALRGQTDYDAKGRGLRHFGVAQDVTGLKSAESELIQAKFIAEKANLAKSDFLSSMSHELRSPLNAILGFAQLIESGSPLPTPRQKASIDQILHAGWYLLELINEILDLSLIESGKLSLAPETISVNEVLSDCQAMIGPQAEKSGIRLSFPQCNCPYFVKADPTRLKQALINLLSNAIKYNREHGTVEVKCAASTPECIRISVKDSGMGLPAEKLVQLFQPFNRLGQEASTQEGTGIGLVVTKQLVELMGGTIGVESTVGVGSEFWIELIRNVTPQLITGNATSVKLAPQAPGNGVLHTLLYVEDDPANLMLVEQIIEDQLDLRLLSAHDGKLGIALARANLPDVILMDINLPGISGIEALKILREDPATTNIPVVALSANAMPQDIKKGLDAGFFRYITKPIKINEFMKAVDDALNFSHRELVNTNQTGQLR